MIVVAGGAAEVWGDGLEGQDRVTGLGLYGGPGFVFGVIDDFRVLEAVGLSGGDGVGAVTAVAPVGPRLFVAHGECRSCGWCGG